MCRLTRHTGNFSDFSNGFTLAEVLITLGIIGVVASLTMPALLANYKKQETVTRLKKAYSIVEQAIKLSEVYNESSEFWSTQLHGKDFFNKYIKNYVQYVNEYSTKELWDIAPRKLLNGKNYSGTTYAPSSVTATNFVLSDGTMITLNYVHPSIWVGIDVNGLKKPNQIGKDTFLFIFTNKYGLQPLGGAGTEEAWSYGEFDRNKILTRGGHSCNRNQSGYWCASIIMNDRWEIGKDYPW